MPYITFWTLMFSFVDILFICGSILPVIAAAKSYINHNNFDWLMTTNNGWNNYHHQHHHDLDGINLKDGKEMKVHMQSKQLKEYFFRIKEDGVPLWVVVTPCGGVVKWKLTQQIDSDGSEDNEVDDWFGSGRFLFSVKPAKQKYHSAIMSNRSQQLDSLSLKHKQMLDWKNPPSTRYLPHRLPAKESLLVREVGSSAMEYTRDSTAAGNLHLYLLATENDTLVRIFITAQDQDVVRFFPLLPRRKRVFLSNISTNSVAVHWYNSPSADGHSHGHSDVVEYCLVLSSIKDYPTYCALQQDLRKKYSVVEKSNVVNFEHYRTEDDKMPVVAYIRHKTNYFFDNLQKSTKYHLSLFARNLRTGGSVSYEGASFVTRVEHVSGNSAVRMQDGRMYASYLNPTRSSFRLYEFVVDRYRHQIVMTVQPCAGYVRLHLYKDGRLLRKSVFEDLKTLIVFKVTPGVLRVKVTNDDSDAKLFKIWASIRPLRNPYPSLPVDTSIKVLEYGRTCQSITLAWLGSFETQDYCMYKRMEEEEYFKQLILEESNLCRGPPKNKQPVFCRRFKVVNESQLIMKASVDNLQPATTYRFDLYVSKPSSGQHLSYRTVWAKTKTECNDS